MHSALCILKSKIYSSQPFIILNNQDLFTYVNKIQKIIFYALFVFIFKNKKLNFHLFFKVIITIINTIIMIVMTPIITTIIMFIVVSPPSLLLLSSMPLSSFVVMLPSPPLSPMSAEGIDGSGTMKIF